MSKPRYSVLLDDPDVLTTRLREVTRVVAKALEQPIPDAAQQVRYGHGILVRDVLGPYAKEISRGLAQLGIGSFTVESQPGQTAVPRAKRLGGVKVSEDELTLAVRFKPEETFPWADVLALHAHATIRKSTSSDEGDPLPKRGGDVRTLSTGVRKILEEMRTYEERERTVIGLGLDVLVKGPKLFRLSYDTPGVYANLDGRIGVAVANYLLLLETLLTAASGRVLIPPTTRRLRARHEFTDVLFVKPEELESFNGWILHALEQGISYGEPEDVDDDVLHDEEEALVVAGDDADADDIDDDDIDDDDLDESADPDTDGEAEAESESESESKAEAESEAAPEDDLDPEDLDDSDLAADDLEAAKSHFENTQRLEVGDVNAMLEEAQSLELGEESADPDEEVKQAMDFFDGSSGGWDVRGLPSSAKED